MAKKITLAFSVLLLIFAFFTRVIGYAEDPTDELILTYDPFFEGRENEGYIILLSDENGMFGKDLFLLIHKLKVMILIFTLFLFYKNRKEFFMR